MLPEEQRDIFDAPLSDDELQCMDSFDVASLKRGVEADFGRHKQDNTKLKGIVELDATGLGSFVRTRTGCKRKFHVQLFGCAQRPDASGRGLRVHVYEMELAETCLRAVSAVEA